VFYVLLFSTDQWKRLIPTSLDVFPNALSTALQYLSLDLPTNEGFSTYNALQLLAYFITVFIAAPVALVTGLLQAPSIAGRFGTGAGLLNRQVARTIHFGVLLWMLVFIAVHTLMIFVTGFVGNVNHMTLGTDTDSWLGVALYALWMTVVIVCWLAASPLTTRHPRAIQRVGRFLVGGIKGFLERTAPTATAGRRVGRLPTADRRLGGQSGRTDLSAACGDAETGADHPALLHPGLVRGGQVGGRADALDL
jgi:methionine sulfoxide reductase catalytic subunit